MLYASSAVQSGYSFESFLTRKYMTQETMVTARAIKAIFVLFLDMILFGAIAILFTYATECYTLIVATSRRLAGRWTVSKNDFGKMLTGLNLLTRSTFSDSG